MGYSKEFIEWTNSDLDYTFEVKEVSAGMLSCEGTGYVGMFKDFEGNLMLKMNSDNQDGFIMEKYVDVKGRFLK